jgi:hypothetical protein
MNWENFRKEADWVYLDAVHDQYFLYNADIIYYVTFEENSKIFTKFFIFGKIVLPYTDYNYSCETEMW